jgi:hypothetical protein
MRRTKHENTWSHARSLRVARVRKVAEKKGLRQTKGGLNPKKIFSLRPLRLCER